MSTLTRIRIEILADLEDAQSITNDSLVESIAERIQSAVGMGVLDAGASYTLLPDSVSVDALACRTEAA